MKKLHMWLSAIVLFSATTTLLAQGSEFHPALSDSFTVSLGAMRSSNAFDIKADATGIPGDDVDFNDSLGVSDHSTFFNGQLRWKFGHEKKWVLSGQYFSNKATGTAVLTEDVEWDGLTFGEGTTVDSGVKLGVSRLAIGWSFIKKAQHDMGIQVGIHNLDAKVFIEGEALVDGDTTGFQRGELSGSQILPNIGGWYNFSPGKNWLLHARVDWISADVNDYGGHMWNNVIGINYQAFRHVGFDLYWQYFNLQVRANKTDWRGKADMTYSGPVLAVTFNW